MNPVHSPSSCYYNIHFNIILPPANRSLPLKFYGQNSACILRSLKHATFSYCDMALLRELKSTNANVKLLAVALPCMKFPALMESEVCCRVLKGFPLLSISQANVRPKVTSLEHFATLLERFQVTHIYITNILLYDCTNDGMMWQTERGCMQNKEKGTVTLKVCTKGPPILSKSHLEPTAECVQWSVPQWSFAVFKPCSTSLSWCPREHTISIFRVTESEDTESIFLQTIKTGLHYALSKLKHHSHPNNYRENQKQLKSMLHSEAQM